ncbi:Mce-associated membrane protein [Rhodococcus sp. SMB37]|uniref:hypothetical protein n=1 Tax=Rhodococcus sp. SMB37 TaxID=2512213 RepID=UPI0006D26DC2|nr:hypothetical protein [Rhodococcus sp. SMB37]TCN49009.1 Mce-associated membrane protein [Rhodococcus sp. SMB37]
MTDENPTRKSANAATEESASASAETGESDQRPTRRSGTGRAVAIAVIVLLAVVAGVFGFRWWQAEQTDSLRTEAVDAAREYATTLGTYDYRSFDDSLAAVTAASTEEFSAKYSGVAGDLRGLVENGQGSSVATVSHAGLETLDGETATVLVFLDQDVKNVVVPEGRTDATRFLITLKRIDGRWMLDGADAK